MKDLKRAFGSPDPEFRDRVRQTLFQIEEKEETVVKKKLTLSMAMALILCICIVTASALAGSELLSGKPDVTQSPLAQGENGNPNGPLATLTPMPTQLPLATTVPGDSLSATSTPLPTLTPMPTATPVPTLQSVMATQIPRETAAPDDPDNPLVYAEQDLTTFHYVSSLACTDRVGALTSMSLTDALNEGALPCRECLTCYIGEDSNLYHMSETCERLSSAQLQLVTSAVQDGYQPCVLCVRFYDLNNAKHHRFARCSEFGDDVNAYIPCSLNFPALLGSAPCKLCVPESESYPAATSTPMPTELPDAAPAPGYYYYTPEDQYCHSAFSCLNEGDSFIGVASEAELIAMGKRACEACMEPFSYYYTSSDRYYHTFECARIADEQAEALPEDELLALGKRDCPWCLGWSNYYSSAEDGYYHKTSSCDQHFGTATFNNTEAEFIEMGKEPCAACLDSDEPTETESQVFSTAYGTFYHSVPDCSGMKNAEIVSLSVALKRNQFPCPVCTDEGRQSADAPIVYLWDSDAPVYHSVYNCSGFEYLHQMALTDAVAKDLVPCPECLNTEDTVFFTEDSEYYHSYLHYAYLDLKTFCGSSPMDALANGKRPCESCMLTETAKTDSVVEEAPPLWSTGETEVFFYDYSQNHSEALHFSAACEAMVSPVAISLETAAQYELWHCDLCSDDFFRQDCIVQKDDSVYHLSDACEDFSGAELITRWDARLRGLEPCPDCAWAHVTRTGPVPTVPPQPTMPSSSDQAAVKEWLLSEAEQTQCLTDLGYYR